MDMETRSERPKGMSAGTNANIALLSCVMCCAGVTISSFVGVRGSPTIEPRARVAAPHRRHQSASRA